MAIQRRECRFGQSIAIAEGRLGTFLEVHDEVYRKHRVEEVLVIAAIAAGHSVHRSPSAPPAAVLGVRVAVKVSRAA
jgi:hypothetical protein